MKKRLIYSILLFILMSCTHQKPISTDSTNGIPPSHEKSIPKPNQNGEVLIHLISPENLELVLNRSEDSQEFNIVIDKILSQIVLRPGHWKVTGVISNGVHYEVKNGSKVFQFHAQKKQSSYVGSYLFQCPIVGPAGIKEMRKMIYFDRYHFSSHEKSCELIIGSDFKRVKKVWARLKGAKFPLSLGF